MLIYLSVPLLEAVIGIIREKYNHLLKQGAVMLDKSDMSEDVQAVFLVEHEIHDGRKTVPVCSKQFKENAIRHTE